MNRTCARTGECCPEQCLGGCIRNRNNNNNDDDKNNDWKCFSCKKFRYQNRCYDTCPNNSYAVSYLNKFYFETISIHFTSFLFF